MRCVPGIPDTLLSVSQSKKRTGVKFDFDASPPTFKTHRLGDGESVKGGKAGGSYLVSSRHLVRT